MKFLEVNKILDKGYEKYGAPFIEFKRTDEQNNEFVLDICKVTNNIILYKNGIKESWWGYSKKEYKEACEWLKYRGTSEIEIRIVGENND